MINKEELDLRDDLSLILSSINRLWRAYFNEGSTDISVSIGDDISYIKIDLHKNAAMLDGYDAGIRTSFPTKDYSKIKSSLNSSLSYNFVSYMNDEINREEV